jgi:16S rRNA (guanine527-N7)-methyltransferase
LDLATGARLVLGHDLAGPALDLFDKYLNILLKWNRTQRLVGSGDAGWITEHLFIDSLFFLPLLPPAPVRIGDFGSGAGIPGVPIKIVRPELDLTLIESRRKRASFLSAVVRELGLPGLRVVEGRIEQITGEPFDLVVARCAGRAEAVVAAARVMVREGGRIIVTAPARVPPEQRAWLKTVESADGASRRRFLDVCV